MKKTVKRLKHRFSSKVVSVTVILLIALIGMLVWSASKAASPYVANEAESGTLGGDASNYTDSTASDGSAVKFGSGVVNPPSGGFVTTQGTKFMLDGKEFKFVGFNLHDAAATNFYKCASWTYSDAELESAIKYMRETTGSSVLRFWAFQSYTKSGTDWTGIDKIIRLAKANGLKLMPTLENGPGHCGLGNNGQAKYNYNGDTWYTEGYKQKYGSYTKTLAEYIDVITARYKDEPTIMAWMIMNEADTSRRDNGSGDCRDGGTTVLVPFARELSDRIRANDPNHLITLGTQSNGACGGSGLDYAAINSLPNINFGNAHDWGFWADPNNDWWKGERDPLPGSTDGITLPSLTSPECNRHYQARIACSIASAKTNVKKPIVITEAGSSTHRFSLADRANNLDKKMNAAFTNGVSGYLIWQWNKVVDSEGFDVLPTTNDPLLGKLKVWADSFR